MNPSQRLAQVTSFIAMDLMEECQRLSREGRDIISLALGEPDFMPPQVVDEACIQALRDHQTKYTHSQGLLELREALCLNYKNKYGVAVTPEQVIVTQGSSPAMLLAFAALIDVGDEVIIPNPHYPCYPNFVRFLSGVPVEIVVSEDHFFHYHPDQVRMALTPRTKALVLNSPANPTGQLCPSAVMAALAHLDIPIIADEIYHGLVYAGKEESILHYTDKAFVIGGFSKTYAMTGYRLGYVIVPPDSVRPIQCAAQNLYISANSFVQAAGLAALRCGETDRLRMLEEYRARRQVMLAGVRALGWGVAHDPQGAFYVFANVSHLTTNSYDFAWRMLHEIGVAVTPGIDFGSAGEGYVRLSYVNTLAKIEEAMARLRAWL